MLGVNLVFAGFALTLNGMSYLMEVDHKVKGAINLFVGVIIAINAIFQIAQAVDHVTFGFAAAMWLFALNYFIIAVHLFFRSENWKAFGLYGLFASLVSVIFTAEAVMMRASWEFIFMWSMWAVLWAQGFFAIVLENKLIDKFTPHVLIINGVTSTFIPGILILLGIIL